MVVARGELDIVTIGELKVCFDKALAAQAPLVNVDFSQVTFIDSSSMKVLVQAFRALRDRDHRLVVTAASR